MTNIISNPSVIKDIILGTCLCILIFAISYTFPFLGVFALLLLPLPVLYFRLKLGRKSGGIVALVSFIVLMVMTRGFAFDTLYFGALLMTGLFLGECIEHHMGIEKTMIVTVTGVLVSVLAVFVVYAGIQTAGMGDMISSYITQYFSLTSDLYTEMGIEKEQIDTLNAAFLIVMPGMLIVSYMTTVWLNILIIKKLLLRIGIHLKNLAELNRFKAPDRLVWVVIGLGLLLVMPIGAAKYVSINCLIILMLVYFFQGIAVISFYFQKKGSPTFLKVFCYGLIAVQIYFLILVIGLGFFDNWINFRKLEPQNDNTTIGPF
ncbi:MAG: YybS family protein [Desulfotignum sp.]|nr:YybS family protein [Desulfotignum sp.]MCF8113229.1 YybS family protein [Desulfotignum sp.]MCF8126122.1 YybS family protein [Desulfotignum sp.]